MSHIPSSAMPHAGPKSTDEKEEASGSSLSDRAGKIADKARENPKTAIAAGAAVIAGVAAAAIPLVRASRSKAEGKSGSGGAKKPAAKKKS